MKNAIGCFDNSKPEISQKIQRMVNKNFTSKKKKKNSDEENSESNSPSVENLRASIYKRLYECVEIMIKILQLKIPVKFNKFIHLFIFG